MTGTSSSYETVKEYKKLDSDEGQLLTSKLDQIYDTLYRRANFGSKTTTNQRNKPILDQWKRLSSRISDQDRLLLADLFFNSSSVVEFGSGETTLIASMTGIPRYLCIEVDGEKISMIRNLVDNESIRFFFSDIGQVDEYGYPDDDMLPKIPYDYQVVPLLSEREAFDLYLVHGINSKGSCAIMSFLHAMKCGADISKVVVGIMEVNHHPIHIIISEVADLINQSDNLSLYKLKSTMTSHALFDTWQKLERNQLLIPHPLPNGTSPFQYISDNLFAQAMEYIPFKKRKFSSSDKVARFSSSLEDLDRQLIGDIYYNASSVFEFGLGESSVIASWVGVSRFVGVDSDELKISYLQKKLLTQHFRLFLGDVGSVVEFGEPYDVVLPKNQYDYQVAPLIGESSAFDVYYIDGPWRQACVAISFLHAIKHKGDLSTTKVIVHDTLRSEYDFIEENIADVFMRNDHLWIFKIKNGVTEDTILDFWNKVYNII